MKDKDLSECKLIETEKEGMVLVNYFCKKCNKDHPKWVFLCICENGKIQKDPIGYKVCNFCNGSGYVNKRLIKNIF